MRVSFCFIVMLVYCFWLTLFNTYLKNSCHVDSLMHLASRLIKKKDQSNFKDSAFDFII